MHRQVDLDEVINISDLAIERFVDDRGYKLQFIAAEKGHLVAVDYLINRGFEFDCKVEGRTPAGLAFSNKHYGVVLNLLKSNFKFPQNFNAETASVELQVFAQLSSEFHEAIVKDEVEKLKEILANNTDLRYFYNFRNKSAICAAIENKRFHLYELLLTNKIYPAPHDDMHLILQRLRDAELDKVQDINEKLSGSVLAEPIATFMRNSFFGPDCPDRVLYNNFIYKAYSHLLQIKRIEKIMIVVAASRVFKIVYDFKRETVSFVDPMSEPYTTGIFYISGKIYIGAKGLVDPNQYYQVLGVIAHELCHYAMFLTYDNMAKPYYKKDKAGMKKFEEIVQDCEAEKVKEKIISLVFSAYEEEVQHAETIVRVPQMAAHYHEEQANLTEKIATFPTLFENYDEEVMPEMDKALPRIKRKYRTEGEKQLEKQRRMTAMISLILALFVLASIPLGIWLKGVNYSWDTLTDTQKEKVNDAVISYYGVEVKFSDIFGNVSEVHKNLNHEQIKGALDGDPKELNMVVKTTFYLSISLNWESLTVKLKEKVLSTNVSFQGAKIPMKEFLSNESQALPFLSSSNLKSILNSSESFEVASKIENNFKFYQERKFVLKACDLLKYSLFDCEIEFNSEKELCEKFKNDRVECEYKSDDDVINLTSKNKLFLLSNKAGDGKSTTMKHLGSKLKLIFPGMWIQEVDLKKNLEAFDFGKNLNLDTKDELVSFLGKHLINSTDFNVEVFKELFNKGQVVFLLDGADEIFPYYQTFMINLVKKISNLSENWQFISTREQYSKDLSSMLNIEAFKFVPLNRNASFEFLLKYIATSLFQLDAEVFYGKFKNFQKTLEISDELESYLATFNTTTRERIKSAVNSSKNTLESIANWKIIKDFLYLQNNLLLSPLLIQMIAETASFNQTTDKMSGIYSIYDSFVNRKHAIALNKGGIVQESINNVTNNPQVTYKKIHQLYALKLIVERHLSYLDIDSIKFFEEKLKIVTASTNLDEISRFGILSIYPNGYFDFVHRTFAEFFVAQYFIYDVENFKEANDDFTKIKLAILKSCFYSEDFNIVKNFFVDFLSKNKQNSLAFYLIENQVVNYVRPKTLKFFNFANASFHFANYHKIPHSLIVYNEDDFKEVENFISECFTVFKPYLIMENLSKDWNYFKKYYKKEVIKFSLKLQDENKINILLQIFYFETVHSLQVKKYLKIFSDTYTRSELQEMYFSRNESALMKAVRLQSASNLNYLWNFTQDIFDVGDQKNLLSTVNQQNLTVLELSANRKNGDIFIFIQELYLKLFEPQVIQNMIESSEVIKNAYLHSPLYHSFDLCQTFFDLFCSVYSDNKKKLRKILTHNFEFGTIFSQYGYDNKCLKIYKDLLRKTYADDEEKLFKSDFDALDNALNFNLTDLKRENIFIDKYTNILTKYAPFLKEKPLRELWEFLELNLNAKEMNKLLLQKDSNYYSALHKSAMNKSPKSFNLMKKVYEENLSSAEIKGLILIKAQESYQESIIHYSLYSCNIETCKAVSNFLHEFFKNDKIALRKLLWHQKGNKTFAYIETIDNDCVKVLLKLLRQTYGDDEEELYQSDLNELRESKWK